MYAPTCTVLTYNYVHYIYNFHQLMIIPTYLLSWHDKMFTLAVDLPKESHCRGLQIEADAVYEG